MVTLTGPGGVGKARLALALAHRQIRRRSDRVWLVDLAAGPQTPDVGAETARVLGCPRPARDDPDRGPARYLPDRDVLVVLDNCEHVVDGCAQLAAALLTTCAGVRIMATSRESLGVSGETVWRLEPLGPEDAYRLFVERARQRRPGYVPGEQSDAAINELCARLDRLPLAIELSAARVSVMSPAEVLAGLKTRLGGLGGGGRLSPPHHRTVRATVEWSHQLLDPAERQAFRSLAVFVAGFDADAAASIAPGLSLDVLARLVDKSLVAVMTSARGRTRYRLLETVREYAASSWSRPASWTPRGNAICATSRRSRTWRARSGCRRARSASSARWSAGRPASHRGPLSRRARRSRRARSGRTRAVSAPPAASPRASAQTAPARLRA